VQKVILNINIQVENAASGAVLLNKSVDLRGNIAESWRCGISYMMRRELSPRLQILSLLQTARPNNGVRRTTQEAVRWRVHC
jgi:hypothetical protein